jgi:hypothetical protein
MYKEDAFYTIFFNVETRSKKRMGLYNKNKIKREINNQMMLNI